MASTGAAKRAERRGGATATRRRKTHKYPVERAEELLASTRSEDLDPLSVLALLPMRVYHHIADIGCGPGYFTIPLAKYTFNGKVYAVDIQEGMLDITRRRLEHSRLQNVEPVLCKETKIPLDDESLDGALIVNTLHEATQPKTLLKETFRLLRKSGWVGIVDWRKIDMDEGPPTDERVDREEAAATARDTGFRVPMCHDLNDRYYIILLAK